MGIVINVVLYQLIWFLCVLGGNRGALAALSLLLVHLALTRQRGADLRMMAFMLFLGLLVDGTLQQFGFFRFTVSGFPIPLWLTVVWLGLAITLNHSLAWMKKRPLLSALFGALGGPSAYWAGVRLGAAHFLWPQPQALVFLAFVWAMIWPLTMYFSVILSSGLNEKDLLSDNENK